MSKRHRSLDEMDTRILEILQKDCRIPLEQIANKLRVPKSTLHYRIKRLETEKIIEGYYAKVDAAKLGRDFITITLIRTKSGPRAHKIVGKMLAQISGVCAVYFVLGETNFVVLAKSNNHEDFMEKLEKIMNMEQIERSSTQVVAKVIKEDPRIELEYFTSLYGKEKLSI